jgi:hypothetical protein
MPDAEQYRKFAAQCRVLWALTLDPEIKHRLLLLAEEYENAAAMPDPAPKAEPPAADAGLGNSPPRRESPGRNSGRGKLAGISA